MKIWQRWSNKLVYGLVLPLAVVTTGCGRNPVTGDSEIQFISEPQEIAVGKQNYSPMQQIGGGDYNARPEVVEYVKMVGHRLARYSHRPDLPYYFVVINSSVPNAWALPGGKIAINRGLLAKLKSEAELAAVLGHEIVHAAARHGAKAMERGMIMEAGAAGISIALADHSAKDLVEGSTKVGLGLINSQYSQKAEMQADFYGIEYMAKAGYDTHAAVELQELFLELSEGQNDNWLSGLFASHPPSKERVAANKKTIKKYQPGGIRGEDDYARKMDGLKADEPGYQAMEEGYAALKAKDYNTAEDKANTAIKIVPYEAHFFNLLAKAKQGKGDQSGAMKAYNNAIAMNNDYFDYWLQRGLLHKSMGQAELAIDDLEKSNQLLSTSVAHQAIGELYQADGDEKRARQHFDKASADASPAGSKALRDIHRMEVVKHPETLVSVGQELDELGFVKVTAKNTSRIPLTNIKVRITDKRYRGKSGQTHLQFDRALSPGESATIATRIGPFKSLESFKELVQTEVLSADEPK